MKFLCIDSESGSSGISQSNGSEEGSFQASGKLGKYLVNSHDTFEEEGGISPRKIMTFY